MFKPNFAPPAPNFIPPWRPITEAFQRYNADYLAGTLSLRSYQHISKFILDCKEAGVWSLLTFCMPFVGTNLATASRELITGATTAFTNFIEADFTEATGVTGNGSTKYLDCGTAASALLAAAGHISFYQRTDETNAAVKMKMGTASGTEEFWIGGSTTSNAGRYGKTNSVSDATANLKGFYYVERLSATDLKIYRNNTQLGTLATNIVAVPPGQNIQAWCYNAAGTPTSHTAVSGSFLSLGQTMTAQQRADFYTIVQTLQTNLGRQV